MQTIIPLNAITLFISDIPVNFIIRTLILGFATFFFFFLLMRTLDRENIYKFNAKDIAGNLKFIKHANATVLVRDGVLQLDKLIMANVTPQQVYEAIRSQKIRNLSEVERLFVVAGGEFSVYRKHSNSNELPVYQYTPKVIFDKQGKA